MPVPQHLEGWPWTWTWLHAAPRIRATRRFIQVTCLGNATRSTSVGVLSGEACWVEPLVQIGPGTLSAFQPYSKNSGQSLRMQFEQNAPGGQGWLALPVTARSSNRGPCPSQRALPIAGLERDQPIDHCARGAGRQLFHGAGLREIGPPISRALVEQVADEGSLLGRRTASLVG